MENVNMFTLSKLWEVLKKYFLWILLVTVVIGCVSAICGQFVVVNQYTCRLEYLLDDVNGMSNSELNNQSKYVDDAIRKLSSTTVVKKIVEDANLFYQGYKEGELPINEMKAAVKISPNTSNSGFTITVTHTDSLAAYAMIRTYRNNMKDLIDEYGLMNLLLIEEPEGVPTKPSNGNRPIKYGLIGAAASAVLMYAIFLIHDSFDVTIRSEQDLKKFINLPLLGMIPLYSGEVESGEKIMNKSHGDKDKDKNKQ